MDTSVNVSQVTLRTDRLLLRPLAKTDLEDFYTYASVPGVGEMAGWKHHESMEESRAILAMLIESKENLAIVHQADGKMIGTLGLHPAEKAAAERYPQHRMREIGYVLSKAYWGQGLMAEAVQAVTAYCFHTLKLDALVCCHFAENSQSRRVIEKCDFRFLLRHKFVSERLNKTFDNVCYILFRDDADQSAAGEG